VAGSARGLFLWRWRGLFGASHLFFMPRAVGLSVALVFEAAGGPRLRLGAVAMACLAAGLSPW